jgi:hypothetical protein
MADLKVPRPVATRTLKTRKCNCRPTDTVPEMLGALRMNSACRYNCKRDGLRETGPEC